MPMTKEQIDELVARLANSIILEPPDRKPEGSSDLDDDLRTALVHLAGERDRLAALFRDAAFRSLTDAAIDIALTDPRIKTIQMARVREFDADRAALAGDTP